MVGLLVTGMKNELSFAYVVIALLESAEVCIKQTLFLEYLQTISNLISNVVSSIANPWLLYFMLQKNVIPDKASYVTSVNFNLAVEVKSALISIL